MPKKAAVEIMVLNPDPAVHYHNKSVHENLWIKERYGKDNYLSIGVLLKETTLELQFYFFEDCDKSPHPPFFSSLEELQKHLPSEKQDIFGRTHKVYLMGHGDDKSKYGFGNYHAHNGDCSHLPDASEQIYDDKFDVLIQDILRNTDTKNITLEACYADNLFTAKEASYTQSFLERLSANYSQVTFSGTGPWSNSKDLQESLATGSRASGGYPSLHAPITSTGGGVWKHGNTVIFYHNGDQIAVRKSPFASTETAKNLKINTVNYARKILNQHEERETIVTKICANRKILTIEDLMHEPAFSHPVESVNEEITKLVANEQIILKQEQDRYLQRVNTILSQDKYSDRDALIIALGLNHRCIFKGNEAFLDNILANNTLLSLVMVACGKVLVAGPSNDGIIDFLLQRGIDINSVDEKGMTALHYAVQRFYDYRKEQLYLIEKLIESGANLEATNEEGKTPWMLAKTHSMQGHVMGGENLITLLQKNMENYSSSAEQESQKTAQFLFKPSETYPNGIAEDECQKIRVTKTMVHRELKNFFETRQTLFRHDQTKINNALTDNTSLNDVKNIKTIT